MRRHPEFGQRQPEVTSLASAKGFSKVRVLQKLFSVLEEVVTESQALHASATLMKQVRQPYRGKQEIFLQ
jgi:hypothetical protein